MIDPLLQQLLAGFVDEAQEIYERATRDVMEMEGEPAEGERFDDLARGLHTLKGSAATLGLEELADFAHRMEDVVLPLRGSSQPLPAALADAVLRSLDVWMTRLRATAAGGDLPDLQPSVDLLANLEEGKPPEAQPPRPPPEPEESSPSPEEIAPAQPTEETWRVSTRQVIELFREVERLREVRLRIDERRRDLDKSLAHLKRLDTSASAGESAETRALLLDL